MMTKQHFEAIAHVLDANVTPLPIVLDFADMLEEQNERFDRARFIDASTIKLLDSHSRTVRMLDIAKRPRKPAPAISWETPR
jgi:hypothetical protein